MRFLSPHLCPSDGYCDFGVCVLKRAPGQPCVADYQCLAPDSKCVDCTAGKCCGDSRMGTACASETDCGRDLYCSGLDGKCRARIPPGSPCELGEPNPCWSDPDKRLGYWCDALTRRCVGGYCF